MQVRVRTFDIWILQPGGSLSRTRVDFSDFLPGDWFDEGFEFRVHIRFCLCIIPTHSYLLFTTYLQCKDRQLGMA